MPVNVTFCTLCDKLNLNGTNSFWEWLCCCLRKKKAKDPSIDEDQDSKIADLEAKIRELEAKQETSSAGSIEDIHTKLAPAGSFIAVYPYRDGSVKTVVQSAHLNQSDITLYNAAREYVVSQGPNLRVFDKEHKSMLGHTVAEAGLPESIESFVNNMMDYTLGGTYVNVITSWEHQLWHFHTHPIYNQHKHKGGEVIGCLFITEPYTKPLMPDGGLDYMVNQVPNITKASTSTPSIPTSEPVPISQHEYAHPVPVTSTHDHTYQSRTVPIDRSQFLTVSPRSPHVYTQSGENAQYSPAQREFDVRSPRVSSNRSPLPSHLRNISNDLD